MIPEYFSQLLYHDLQEFWQKSPGFKEKLRYVLEKILKAFSYKVENRKEKYYLCTAVTLFVLKAFYETLPRVFK